MWRFLLAGLGTIGGLALLFVGTFGDPTTMLGGSRPTSPVDQTPLRAQATQPPAPAAQVPEESAVRSDGSVFQRKRDTLRQLQGLEASLAQATQDIATLREQDDKARRELEDLRQRRATDQAALEQARLDAQRDPEARQQRAVEAQQRAAEADRQAAADQAARQQRMAEAQQRAAEAERQAAAEQATRQRAAEAERQATADQAARAQSAAEAQRAADAQRHAAAEQATRQRAAEAERQAAAAQAARAQSAAEAQQRAAEAERQAAAEQAARQQHEAEAQQRAAEAERQAAAEQAARQQRAAEAQQRAAETERQVAAVQVAPQQAQRVGSPTDVMAPLDVKVLPPSRPAVAPPTPPRPAQASVKPAPAEPDARQAVLARLRRQVPSRVDTSRVDTVQVASDAPRPASPRQRLMDARTALAAGRTDEAQHLLEQAQVQLVLRPVSPSQDAPATGSVAAGQVAEALSMLGAGDVLHAIRYINLAVAQADQGPTLATVAPAPVVGVPQPPRTGDNYYYGR
jgi:hypothetical protein